MRVEIAPGNWIVYPFLDARRHVNKMCAAAGVPLIESGTAGYLGQVQPIIKVRPRI